MACQPIRSREGYHAPDSLASADGDLGTQILAPQVKMWTYRLKR